MVKQGKHEKERKMKIVMSWIGLEQKRRKELEGLIKGENERYRCFRKDGLPWMINQYRNFYLEYKEKSDSLYALIGKLHWLIRCITAIMYIMFIRNLFLTCSKENSVLKDNKAHRILKLVFLQPKWLAWFTVEFCRFWPTFFNFAWVTIEFCRFCTIFLIFAWLSSWPFSISIPSYDHWDQKTTLKNVNMSISKWVYSDWNVFTTTATAPANPRIIIAIYLKWDHDRVRFIGWYIREVQMTLWLFMH